MAGNNGGPWGGGGGNRGNNGGGGDNRGGGGRGPGDEPPQIPEIDELMKKGQERLKVLMGGRGGGGRSNGAGGGPGPAFNRSSVLIGIGIAAVMWGAASFYTVAPEEQSVELFLGKFSEVGTEGLNFAPWPLVTYEVFNVTADRTEEIGVRQGGAGDDGLMLTTDENIVDIDFSVVWDIKDPQQFLFSLREPRATVRSVSESAMRQIIAQSELDPILSRDRGAISAQLEDLIQDTLDQQQTGINIVRVNFNRADPPNRSVEVTTIEGSTRTVSVIDAFRDVQAAEQERDRIERQADAYSNRRTAEARGESAQILEAAEGYRARVVNDARGEASRFLSVLTEYQAAPEVTRKRLYLETMEKVLGDVDKIILDNEQGAGSQGVVPYLPLNELRRSSGGSN